MTEFFYDLLKASFHGSIVILAVILLRQLLKKAPRSVFCLLWLLAGLRLVLPFEIESDLSLQPQVNRPELSIQVQQPVQTPDFLVPEADADLPEAAPDPVNPEDYKNWQSESFLYKAEDRTLSPLTIGDIAAGVWLLGMAVMLTASAVSYIRLKRRVRMAYLVENGCFECPGLETAFVLGFLPPKIYLPAGLTDDEKKFIFDHENTHIARHDHWYKLLGYLVLSLHWFNPLVWIGYSLLCRDIELACDEHVVRNMSLTERKAYSAALLACGGHTARIAACPVAFGESNPKKRILNVLNYKRPTFWISLLAIAAVIFVAVCLLTSPKAGEPLERLSQALEDYQSKGSWHIQANYTYENRAAATSSEMDIWEDEGRWYRVSQMELANGNQQTRGYLSEQDAQYTFLVSGKYYPEYRRWSLAEEGERWYPYWLPRFELKEEEITEMLEEKTENGTVITTVLDPASAGDQYTQLTIRWHLDSRGNLDHVERFEQFTTTENGESFLMGIRMDISLIASDAEEISAQIDSALAELPADRYQAENENADKQPVWTMDMTDEEYMALCRNAVTELQSREQFHITENLSYFAGDKEDSRSEVVFWRDGENRLRQSYVTRRRENRNHLYYEGYLYVQVQIESGASSWTRTEINGGTEYGLPWLCLLQWDNQNVVFEAAEQAGEELRVSVTVHATPPTLGWDDIQEHNIQFFFDKAGNMTRAIMTAQRDDIKVTDELQIEITLAAHIHSELEAFAAQRPDAEQSETDEHWQEKSQTALETYQNQGSWVILVENTFTGEGAMNTYSTALWYIDGQDWYKQAITGSADFTAEHWYLKTAGNTYCRESHTVHDRVNGEGFSTGWTEDSQYADMPLPWPLVFNWDEASLEYVQTEQWDRGEKITFTVRGSMYEGEQRGIDSYQVTFWLTEKGELWSIDITYTQKDAMGETTNARSVITPNAADPEEAAKMIELKYQEAIQ